MPAVATEVVHGTVTFTDIVGFTAFTAEEGDERALAVLAVQDEAVARVLPDGARVVKELGDGLMLWCPDAAQAVRAALLLQDVLADEAEDPDRFPLWIRVGIHTGDQRPRGEDLVGHDVNVAARVVDLAGPGEVLVSQATIREADGGLDGLTCVEVGPTVVKGIKEPVWIHRVEAGF